MRRLFQVVMLLALVAAVLTWALVGPAVADGDAEEKVEVKAQVSGKIVVVGPDGTRQDFDFGDKLPKEMRERIQRHMKAVGKDKLKSDHVVRGKIIMIGPDGKKREINLGDAQGECPKAGGKVQVLKSGGKVVIVGPDGKRREFSFGGGSNKEETPKGDDKDGEDEKATEEDQAASGPRVIRMGRVVVVGPDGKKKEFNLGEMPNIDLDELLPEDLELPAEIEKTVREQIKGIRMLHGTGRKSTARDAEGDAKLKRMQRQIEQLQEQVDQLKKQLDELKAK